MAAEEDDGFLTETADQLALPRWNVFCCGSLQCLLISLPHTKALSLGCLEQLERADAMKPLSDTTMRKALC